MDAKVVDVPEKGRFEVRMDDRVVGLASYHVDGGTMTLPHTEVDPSMGGQGIGTKLVDGVLNAARERGLTVLPYCSADPVLCRHLEEAGCATVMPLGAWIGSNRGLRTRDAIEVIVAQAHVPVGVDAGLGVPSDAAEAMEVGADAVLVNTAIAVAADPVRMAEAFALATRAGRLGYLAGRGEVRDTASASSPLTGFLS